MEGIWLDNGVFSFRSDLHEPEPQSGWCKAEVICASICGTDLELQQGYAAYSGIPGHEFVARVIDPESPLYQQRVVSRINIGCGQCEYCQSGIVEHCKDRRVIGIRNQAGAFAERVVLPTCNLIPIPEELSDNRACLVEPVAAAHQLLTQIEVRGDVLIIGAGRLGQLVSMVLATHGVNCSLLVRNPERKLIAEHVNVVTDADPGRYDVVVDCSGSASGLNTAISGVRPRGTIVLKSSLSNGANVDWNAIVVNEITVVGSRCGPFETAINWLTHSFDADDALKVFPLVEFDAALAAASNPQVFKVLLQP